MSCLDNPHTDAGIGVASEQGVSVRAPHEGDASGVLALANDVNLGLEEELGVAVAVELGDHALGLEIPDADAGGGTSAQPVAVGREDEAVHLSSGVQAVQVLALVEIPEHGGVVLAARSAQAAVGAHGHAVDGAGVALQVGGELALCQGPHLDHLVPAGAHDERVGGVRGEAHAAHPLGVRALTVDGVLALAEGVPQLDGAVAATAHDLAVVAAECNAQHVLLVAHEATGGLTGAQVPEAEAAIPAAGEGELAIRAHLHVGHKVRVALEALARHTVRTVLTGKVPDDDGLVTGAGQQN
eukprot:CAMPEP_0177653034 /NCGR_PEP_ID=MMETSP0447-20121125/13493_1 /TAXON_ID=0 /ORGANISM="Stygamoeba regulata, Strain BSH-02190019" /LENGTH=297 /DNA_ID=CAMNT_0019156409 /DNA_START=34 /DNA_END=927 /DNA_ORIENTATION=-